MSEMTIVLQRLDKMQESIDGLRGELDAKLQDNNKSLQAQIQESANTLRAELAELTRRVDNMEYGLGQEIQAVYALAQKNDENIRQLMPYKSKFVNICMMADRVERLEECQKVTTGVVASHSEAIRNLESRLA